MSVDSQTQFQGGWMHEGWGIRAQFLLPQQAHYLLSAICISSTG